MTRSGNRFHTLPDAMKQQGAKTYLLSGDRPWRWNAEMMARSFGIDHIHLRDSWNTSERINGDTPSDNAVISQAIAKMQRGEVWPDGEKAYVQINTLSGHALQDSGRTADNIARRRISGQTARLHDGCTLYRPGRRAAARLSAPAPRLGPHYGCGHRRPRSSFPLALGPSKRRLGSQNDKPRGICSADRSQRPDFRPTRGRNGADRHLSHPARPDGTRLRLARHGLLGRGRTLALICRKPPRTHRRRHLQASAAT